MEYTSDQILSIRTNLGISQEEFGKSINYSRSYVKDIESGRVKPSRGFSLAVTAKYGVSIDKLLSSLGKQIIDGLDIISIAKGGEGFIYLYDFTDKGINEAEQELLNFLAGKKFKIIDGKHIKGKFEFFAALSGLKERVSRQRHYKYFLDTCTPNDFIVLKQFSESPLKNIMHGFFTEMAHFMSGNLIVLDKPGYLEKHSKELYYHAYPIHFSNRFGFMHY